jgi:hypothetical protein
VYYDFLLRYPELFRDYRSEKKASEILASDEPIDSPSTTIPLEYLTNKNENLQLTVDIDLDRGIYYIGDFGPESVMNQISDMAWRAANLSTFEGHSLYDDTWPSATVNPGPGESGSLRDYSAEQASGSLYDYSDQQASGSFYDYSDQEESGSFSD